MQTVFFEFEIQRTKILHLPLQKQNFQALSNLSRIVMIAIANKSVWRECSLKLQKYFCLLDVFSPWLLCLNQLTIIYITSMEKPV